MQKKKKKTFSIRALQISWVMGLEIMRENEIMVLVEPARTFCINYSAVWEWYSFHNFTEMSHTYTWPSSSMFELLSACVRRKAYLPVKAPISIADGLLSMISNAAALRNILCQGF